jgi:AcrR family transcriptional regulator
VQAARELFYDRGLAAVSMDDVARAAGVSRVTVYSHFDNKEELAAAALAEQRAAVESALDAAVDAAGPDPVAGALAVFDLLADQAVEPGFRGCAFLNAAAQAPDPDHPAHAALREHKDHVRARFRQQAAAAAHSDPDRAADELLLLLDGALAEIGSTGRRAPAQTARRLAELVMRDGR